MLNFQVPLQVETLLTNWAGRAFTRRILFQGVSYLVSRVSCKKHK